MGIRLKLLVPILFLIVALAGTSSYFIVGNTRDQLMSQQDQKGTSLVRLIAQIAAQDLEASDRNTFEDRLRGAGVYEDPDVAYVAVFFENGKPYSFLSGDRSAIPKGAKNIERWREEVRAKPIKREGPDQGFPYIWEFVAPSIENDKVVGVVKLGLDYEPALDAIQSILFHIAMTGIVITIIAVGLALYLSRSVTKPIHALIQGFEALGKGEMNHRLSIQADDEIGALGASFNQMAERVRDARTKMENYSKDLEEMVRARTSELRKAYDELKRLDELKDTFLSSVSHELRTPLTSISSFAEILLQYEDEDPATREEFLGIIKREAERLSRLIDDVLDLAKIEAGMATWKPERCDLRSIVEDAIATIRPLLEAGGMSSHFSYPPRIPQVLCDKDRVCQVVMNLLSNARKFTKQGDTIEARLQVENGFVRCEVEDHGAGIAPENCDRIFEKFRQVEDDGLTNKPKGTGLGLPISRDIVEFHGGKLWVESQIGKGSTFIFTIPTADNPEPRPISKYMENAAS